jgi:hypothetical protein
MMLCCQNKQNKRLKAMEKALNSIDNKVMIDVLSNKKLLKKAIEQGKIAVGTAVEQGNE